MPCNLVEADRRFRSVYLLHQAVCTSETSVNFNETTRRYIPDDYHLHTGIREKLKCNIFVVLSPNSRLYTLHIIEPYPWIYFCETISLACGRLRHYSEASPRDTVHLWASNSHVLWPHGGRLFFFSHAIFSIVVFLNCSQQCG
jgi:hypothetical protein